MEYYLQVVQMSLIKSNFPLSGISDITENAVMSVANTAGFYKSNVGSTDARFPVDYSYLALFPKLLFP